MVSQTQHLIIIIIFSHFKIPRNKMSLSGKRPISHIENIDEFLTRVKLSTADLPDPIS
jgi:hypothetical protein